MQRKGLISWTLRADRHEYMSRKTIWLQRERRIVAVFQKKRMRFKQPMNLMRVIEADDLKYECMLLLLSSELRVIRRDSWVGLS